MPPPTVPAGPVDTGKSPPPPAGALPGQFAFRQILTSYYFSASGWKAGASKTLGPNEKFHLVVSPNDPVGEKTIHAANGGQLYATQGYVADGSDRYPGHVALSSSPSTLPSTMADNTRFFIEAYARNDTYAGTHTIVPKIERRWPIMQTGDFRNPEGGVALFQETAMSLFRVLKCGDVGSGTEFAVRMAGSSTKTPQFPHARLRREQDGTYVFAFEEKGKPTRYMSAAGGGGYASDKDAPDGATMRFDRTSPLDWERFKLIDQGNCTYAIQTWRGFVVAYKEGVGYSTAFRDVAAAAMKETRAAWDLTPLGL